MPLRLRKGNVADNIAILENSSSEVIFIVASFSVHSYNLYVASNGSP